MNISKNHRLENGKFIYLFTEGAERKLELKFMEVLCKKNTSIKK